MFISFFRDTLPTGLARALMLWVALVTAPAGAAAPPIELAGTEWARAAQSQAIDPVLLYALALARTGTLEANTAVTPWPWTLTRQGEAQRYPDHPAALRALAQASPDQRAGLELGLMAISLTRWRHRVSDPSALLDPAANLRLGAAILADSLRATPNDLELAVGHFAHADPTAARAFGQRVLRIAHALGMRAGTNRAGRDRHVLVRPLITAAARRHGLDPAFALAIAQTESHFNQAATSRRGARGVMQLMPRTAQHYGVDAGDLEQNIDGGVRYLRDLAERFGGSPTLVAAAYNAGEDAVLKYRRQIPPYPETQHYVPQVVAAREYYGCISQ
ncbi:transglycosylase SLT domain-containing protein [uncultured Thiodictyon sp.]|uniref:lytic transglycosylase domain-containing protein n=1 Tax=uncultured Thiodictyon sp. TaxID=1846217 RepID=UPI0025DF5816|nr:transglycosylase SLT domain-containing protein [uncultured Thiodictyon sp.]